MRHCTCSGLRLFASILLLSVSLPVLFAETEYYTAMDGVLRVDSEYFRAIHPLQGQWVFRFQGDETKTLVTVPSSWNGIRSKTYETGSYELRIECPPELLQHIGPVGLLIPDYAQIIEVRANDTPIFSSGSADRQRTGYTRALVPLELEPIIHLDITFTNTSYRNGGMYTVPMFGEYQQLLRYREQKIILEALAIGLFFLVALYHLLLFIWRYQNISAAYLSLAGLLMVVRSVVTGESSITIFFPQFSWNAGYHIEYVSAYLVTIAILQFINSTFPDRNRAIRTGVRFVSFGLGVTSFISAFLPAALLSKSIYVLQTSIFIALVLGIIIIFRAHSRRSTGATLFFWGALFSILLVLIDFSYYLNHPLRYYNTAQMAMFCFLSVQTMVLSRIYGNAYLQAERLTHSLEAEVAQRTANLKKSNRSLKEEIQRREKVEERLTLLSTTDPLTGCANRNKMNELLSQHHRDFTDNGKTFGLIMFDADQFKRVNDEYGHEVGDRVLKRLVDTANESIRQGDVLSRWGGEEFLVLLPNLNYHGAIHTAERIRNAFESILLPPVGRVTASFGAAIPRQGETVQALLVRLDGYLYRAKQAGRNRVVYS